MTAAHFNPSDTGNAERFAAQHRDRARYVDPLRQWFVWDGRHWKPDARGAVELLAKETVRSLYTALAIEVDDDTRKRLRTHAAKSESRQGRENMLALARAEVAAAPDDFDRDPWLFNVANGTLDLRTGKLQAHEPRDMLTKVVDIAYDPAAACPTFDRFLARVLGDSPDLISYVQKAVGYSLSGSVQEQCFFFLHGEGANGKSTLADVLMRVLGPYGKAAAPDLLMAREHEAHSSEQADLQGARFVVCQEIAEGKSWNERTLKHLTGGDIIKARLMHKDWIQFRPTHKLWVCANPKPKMREGGLATWRRVRLIPFEVVIPSEERDRNLGTKLAAELPGILRWAVDGCLRWQTEGLEAPAQVSAATDEYREESDHVTTFVSDRLELGDDRQVTKTGLYEAYTLWCKHNQENAMSRNDLQKRLVSKGLSEARSGRDRLMRGASLRFSSGLE